MLLGIDQGTTGTRACLVDASGRIDRQAYRAHRQLTPRPGWVEHDVDEIWANTAAVIAEVLAGAARPDGVALANQGETVVIWDARTLRPLHHALVWQDTRTQDAIARLADQPGLDARVRDETGLRLDPYFSAPKLRWLLDEVPSARALAADGHLRAGTLDTYLIARLTGGATFATDASTAARTLLCETRAQTWSPFLLELFAIPRSILADIRDSDGDFGACRGHGLDGVPIVASLVDQPAALAGQGLVERGDVKATFGTGCFVYANTGSERSSADGTLGTVAWRRSGATTYALDGGVLSVGSALDWLRRVGLLEDPLPPLAASRDPHVVCVPSLVGLGAPHWDRAARAGWLGISSSTTRDDLIGAFVEGLACRIVEVVRAVERDSGFTAAEFRADGGLSRAPALMQVQADLLGIPVVVAEEPEATIVGACAMGSLRIGELALADLRARRHRTSQRFEPVISADAREARLATFARARAVIGQWR